MRIRLGASMPSLPYKKLDLASEFGSLGLRDVVAPDIFFYTTPNLSHVSVGKRCPNRAFLGQSSIFRSCSLVLKFITLSSW